MAYSEKTHTLKYKYAPFIRKKNVTPKPKISKKWSSCKL